MNEQLVVKNFGPIKDATVDFKRVTVFIGPTGGGKSTLAKLAASFRSTNFLLNSNPKRSEVFTSYSISNFLESNSLFYWNFKNEEIKTDKNLSFAIPDFAKEASISVANKHITSIQIGDKEAKALAVILSKSLEVTSGNASSAELEFEVKSLQTEFPSAFDALFSFAKNTIKDNKTIEPKYFPSNRTFISAIEYSWAGLLRDDIGIPKDTLDFANDFSLSRKDVTELDIPFLNVKYIHRNGQDFIKVPGVETLFRLYEAASGIQSVTPLLVLLEHLSRNTEQAQSFIIEEPELNLYPTAQQGLLNWLVEKCTKGENDLTITTHSPYILSHLNLLLYAYQVAEKHPDRQEAVAAIVPEASWINPKEFACYQVENGGVQSLVDEELGLIDNNELDGLSGDAADSFDNLIRLSKGFAIK
jgi:predicted ATPase